MPGLRERTAARTDTSGAVAARRPSVAEAEVVGVSPEPSTPTEPHNADSELRQEILGVIAQALYEIGDDFDPRMPELWQRGFMTREPHQRNARRVLNAIKGAL